MNITSSLFLQLAIILGLSSVLGFFVRLFKLPLLVAYLLAGVMLSAVSLFDLHQSQALTFLPDIGIAFVLFFIGMELDLKELKSLGKPIFFGAVGQIVITSVFGFSVASILGFNQTESLFLGIGLSVSSTIVAVKMLLERKDLTSLYGKLTLGILLLEDLVSILILMGLSVSSSILHIGLQNSSPFIALTVKAGILFGLAWIFARFILTHIFESVAKSTELLFLVSIAWCFIFISVAQLLGFSVVIGAFLSGVALANSPFHFEIQGKVKPLRDFFVMLFFIYLGSQVNFKSLSEVLPLILIFTGYAIFLKPIIFLLILGAFGFRKHTIFQTAVSLSQISEFSLIIMILGVQMGIIPEKMLTAMALAGVLSIILSSILIGTSKTIFKYLSPFIGIFEHGKFVHNSESKKDAITMQDHVILIGAHRMGGQIAEFLRKENIPLFILDFNPKVIQSLAQKGMNALYGDIGDPEILELLNLSSAKLIISTATDRGDNLMLLSEIKKRRVGAVVVVRAQSSDDAQVLYKAGADYVILPEVVAGEYILGALKAHWPSVDFFRDRAELELTKLSRRHLDLR